MHRALGTAVAAVCITMAGHAIAQVPNAQVPNAQGPNAQVPVAPAPGRNPAQAAWAGQYRYEWAGGRTSGGTVIAVTYALRVGTDVTDCALDVTGYQSDEHIVCEVGANAENLWIRFRSYADGKLVNQYGTAVYRPGQDLFRLRREGKGAPVTEWQSMSPETAKGRPALRFKKV